MSEKIVQLNEEVIKGTITQIVKSIAIHTLIITVVDYTRYFRRKVLNQKEISLKGQYVR